MDIMSYNPNSRTERRRKEKARKRKKIIKILVILALVVTAVAVSVNLIKNNNGKTNEPVNQTENVTNPAPEVKPTDEPGGESNAKTYNFPDASENNDYMNIFNNMEGEEDKICCLTFDDGPNKSITPEILDALEKHGVKASFFDTGSNLSVNKDIAKRAFDEGHLILNHTYDQKAGASDFMEQVTKTDGIIREITGEEPVKMVRIPGGGNGKAQIKQALKDNGYYYVGWSLCVDNYSINNVGTTVLNYVNNNIGSKSVVLLIEQSAISANTEATLDSVIQSLKEKGYTFKRLDEINYYK